MHVGLFGNLRSKDEKDNHCMQCGGFIQNSDVCLNQIVTCRERIKSTYYHLSCMEQLLQVARRFNASPCSLERYQQITEELMAGKLYD